MCGHSLFLASASENPGEIIKVSTELYFCTTGEIFGNETHFKVI